MKNIYKVKELQNFSIYKPNFMEIRSVSYDLWHIISNENNSLRNYDEAYLENLYYNKEILLQKLESRKNQILKDEEIKKIENKINKLKELLYNKRWQKIEFINKVNNRTIEIQQLSNIETYSPNNMKDVKSKLESSKQVLENEYDKLLYEIKKIELELKSLEEAKRHIILKKCEQDKTLNYIKKLLNEVEEEIKLLQKNNVR
jgi:hypothetical protein